jgi:predicted permease
MGPPIGAIVVARLAAHFDAMPPEPFMKMINMLGQAAIPLGLLLLGIQLEEIVRDIAGRRRAAGFAVPAVDASDGAQVERNGPAEDWAQVHSSEPEAQACEERRMSYIAGGLIAAALRIVGGFLVALVVVRFFDFEPTLEKVIIVESSMPTAVNAVVYATEFRCGPKLVAVGILAATLGSMLSVTLILEYLL